MSIFKSRLLVNSALFACGCLPVVLLFHFQLVVEKLLASEGVKRADLGREEFEKRVWEWKRT